MPEKTAHQIDAEAAVWAARIDRGPLPPEQQPAFQAWLQEDVRCMGAFARMRAVALTTERARALGPDFDPAAFVPSSSISSRRRLLQAGGALAATALIGVAATWEVLRHRGRFSTGKGETKVVALKDGSVVTLNTASEILVNYSDRLRSVELIHGEALFDVAKNRAQPFVVTAGDTNVRVVGTSFSVRRLEAAPVQVLVREGIVEVSKPSVAGMHPVRISANTMAVAQANNAASIAALPVPVAQLHRQMAWQKGQIAFEGETLAQAAAEFARYSDTRIVIDDPALAKEEIAGLFKATDPVGFARTIAISLNARARIGEGEVHLVR
jgi:transmembrane sensor